VTFAFGGQRFYAANRGITFSANRKNRVWRASVRLLQSHSAFALCTDIFGPKNAAGKLRPHLHRQGNGIASGSVRKCIVGMVGRLAHGVRRLVCDAILLILKPMRIKMMSIDNDNALASDRLSR
jgi:hypothetical protein